MTLLLGSAVAAKPTLPTAALARILDRVKWTQSDVTAAHRMIAQHADLRVRSTSRGITVLMLAAKTGEVPLARAALRAGVPVNARSSGGQELTALWFATVSHKAGMVRLLLDARAEVDARDAYGRTPLMMATSFKFRDGIRLLIARGASVNARNKSGHTALAYTDGHPGLTHLLRQNGVVD